MTLFGVDVSANQGAIDWPKVAASGVTFMFARATLGVAPDPTYKANIKAAKKAGLVTGAYHYLYHDEPSSARLQADTFMSVVGDPEGRLVAVDVEQKHTAKYFQTTVDDARRFADRWYQRHPGHRLFVYTGGWFWRGYLSNPKGSDIGPLWESHYAGADAKLTEIFDETPKGFWKPGYGRWPSATILQFTSGARVSGINDGVDGDAFKGTRPELELLAATSPMAGPLVAAGGTPEMIDKITIGRGHVTAGTRIFDTPDASVAPIATFPVDKDVTILGGKTGWRVALVTLGGALAGGWIRADELTSVVPEPGWADQVKEELVSGHRAGAAGALAVGSLFAQDDIDGAKAEGFESGLAKGIEALKAMIP